MVAPGAGASRRKLVRRIVGAFAVAVLAGVLAMNGVDGVANAGAAPSRAAADSFEPGTGQSAAQTIKVGPSVSSLAVAITLGQALAGHQNRSSQAESKAVDLGVIGTSLAAQGCTGGPPILPAEDQPQPLRISSSDKGAAQGVTANFGNLIDESVKANDTPSATAVTTTLPIGLPGVLQIGPGKAVATSGVVDGDARVATATVDIGDINIAGGAVSLQGLHWQVMARGGANPATTGTFTIGSLSLAGVPVPIVSPKQVIQAINGVLGILGVVIEWPKAHLDDGVMFVDPLSISIVPNKTRDTLTNGLLNAISPIKQQLTTQLLKQVCSLATEVTVMDIAIGSITGGGSFSLQLGGVQASTGTIEVSKYLGGGLGGGTGPEVAPAPPETGVGGGGGSFGGGAGSLGFGGGSAPPLSTGGSVPELGAAPSASAPGKPKSGAVPVAAHDEPGKGTRGGALAAVAGGVLALVLLLAEADRRKMRHAQRRLPVSA